MKPDDWTMVVRLLIVIVLLAGIPLLAAIVAMRTTGPLVVCPGDLKPKAHWQFGKLMTVECSDIPDEHPETTP